MTSEEIKKVQHAIKEYIDGIDENKIQDRTLDKLISLYSGFLSEIYLQAKPFFKNNTDVKNGVAELKKKKPAKRVTKQERIEFCQSIANDLICLFKQQKILNELSQSYTQLLLEAKEIKRWNKYEQWLSWALDFGEESYLATHIAKLTHSSSKGSSCDVRFHDACDKYNSQYLTTSDKPILDTAYSDNKYSSISQLYKSEVGEAYIGDLLRDNGEKYLCTFTDNKRLLKTWCERFSINIKSKNKKSYFLSKQTYFPIADNQYHLLLPLTSSSLVHELHLEHKKIWDNKGKLDVEQRFAKSQKKNKKYSAINTCTYPNKVYLNVTGSNHSNASSLNGVRGGRISLLSTMPPQWQSNFPSYINKVEIFDKRLAYELKVEIDELRKYLLLLKNKELSTTEPKRNAAVINKLQAISGSFFNYIVAVNNHTDLPDWTSDSDLLIEYQMLFEPCREDDAAKTIKINMQWQKTLSKSYGRWLNNQLKDKNKLPLSPIHAQTWADAFSIELREFIATQEVTI